MGRITHCLCCARLFIALTFVLLPGFARAAAPVVDSFTVSPPAVAPGGTVALTLAAHDPDCPDTCTDGCGQYIRPDLLGWSATGGVIAAETDSGAGSPFTATASWRAPGVEGTYTVSVSVSDSGGFMCGGRETTTAEVLVQVTTNPSQPPVIESLAAQPDQVFPEEPSNLSCVATDPDGDPLTYSWTTSMGVVSASGVGAATFSSADPGLATVTCTVTDSGGAPASASVEILVTDAIPDVMLDRGLVAPQDVAANPWGDLVVADRAAGGVTLVNAVTGEPLLSVRVPGVTSASTDWQGSIVLGTSGGVLVLDPQGRLVRSFGQGAAPGPVTDVTVDPDGRLIWALYGESVRIVAFDETDNVVASFGERGDGPGQLGEPVAIAWSAAGEVLVSDAARGAVLVFGAGGDYRRNVGGLGGNLGEFVRTAGLEVRADGTVFIADAFQSRLQSFAVSGAFREAIGVFGRGLGELATPTGLALLEDPPRLAVASTNGPSIQIYRLDRSPVVVPAAAVTPTVVDFGAIFVGESSLPEVVVLRNTGATAVGVYGVSAPAGYDVQSTCSGGLAPGESCTATVTFIPLRVGRVGGRLEFACSGQGSQRVELAALGAAAPAPLASASSTSLDFGVVPVGSAGPPESLIISNVGGGSLAITEVRLDGPAAGQFAVLSDACTGVPLSAGETCSVELQFSPTTAGLPTAVLAVISNSTDGPLAVALAGDAVLGAEIPTLQTWGVLIFAMLTALGGLVILRRRRLAEAALTLGLLCITGAAAASDPPHWYFGTDCASCHTGHNAAGGNLTTSAGNVNLCQSCHNPSGLASSLPINSSDAAQPGVTGTSHGFDVGSTNAAFGAVPPSHQEMLLRVMNGSVVCSTCHNQHSNSSSNRGRARVSPPDQLTSLGSTGQVTVGGQYTGTAGASYLIEITVASSRFRYSKDGGTSWLAERNIGTDVPLDSGLTVTFAGGSFAVAERWRFFASFPFLRVPLDEGDNAVGDTYCRDCHRDWTMDHVAVETYDGSYKSHPVGQALGANGRGYDRSVPLDGNGGEQGVNGDLNRSNDFRLDGNGLVQCISCHGVHYADSNTLTEDGP